MLPLRLLLKISYFLKRWQNHIFSKNNIPESAKLI
jgi:hypothetical protein